ncbi:hypothetical protein [Glutamicibacter halophytocola]|uniref:hypothetical protein n=1 Tax=Glutamicibacter halophytocola TaxID=1933880 RepID=UPI0015C539BF|nr:hypothetical protein [Glutamicibacter halophytocola]NQD42045.1 hypothetical protein [Glutamicibacter halophytocola]
MTTKPVLVFLHGVGDGDPTDKWKLQLSQSLTELSYPALENIEIIIPKFAHALKGVDEVEKVPPRTHKRPSRADAPHIRREFERRMSAIEFKLGKQDRGTGILGVEQGIYAAVEHSPKMVQASNYLSNDALRAQVLRRVLSKIPPSGKLVLVGHSLGSVIAADLLLRLPENIEVTGFITIGSPLGHSSFNVDKVWDSLREPPAHLSWWVNFWNPADLVTSGRGLSSQFPWMTDYKVTSKARHPIKAHSAVEYLSSPAVTEAIGYALYGSQSKELVIRSSAIEIKPSETETLAILALRYAHLINARLEGDLKTRYHGALRQVQATLIDGIVGWNSDNGRATASSISRLALDLSDPTAELPVPLPGIHVSIDEAIDPLSALVSENVIRPFEITIPIEIKQKALEDLSAELGLTSLFGADIFAAAKRAHETLAGQKLVNWKRWSAVGLGAVALVAATGGLVIAAAPGLAGAALLTSALASFGPGGMVGGLITAGSLAGVGGGGLAFGLASSSTSAADLESVIERMLAKEILREIRNLPSDPAIWQILAETEIQVRREYERLDEFSDANAPGLNEIRTKLTSIERALEYLRKNGHEPKLELEGQEGLAEQQ